MKTFFQNLLILFLLFVWILGIQIHSIAQNKNKILVLQMRDAIDPFAERYVNLAMEEARKIKADYIIVDMNTYGGRVDNADAIATLFLETKIPIFVFINQNTASAGAWISIACDKIYMKKGATIGAASVVNGKGEIASEKFQSYMRGKMRAIAEVNHRNPLIAEAMVNPNVVIPNVKPAGKILTFTSEEAIKNGYCEGEVNALEDILKKNQIKNYTITRFQLGVIEWFISLFLNPYISGILMMIIIGGIYFEMKTPGFGFPIIAATIAAILYFTPYYLTGLAENWELIAFLAGILLFLVEIFLIPGFGIVGVLGLVFMFSSLFLMMVNNKGFSFEFVNSADILSSLIAIAVAIFGTVFLILTLVPKIFNSNKFQDITLHTSMNSEDGYTANTYSEKLKGKEGVSHTVLRPSGKVIIDNIVYDASTQGEFVEKDRKILVTHLEGTSLKVKELV